MKNNSLGITSGSCDIEYVQYIVVSKILGKKSVIDAKIFRDFKVEDALLFRSKISLC